LWEITGLWQKIKGEMDLKRNSPPNDSVMTSKIGVGSCLVFQSYRHELEKVRVVTRKQKDRMAGPQNAKGQSLGKKGVRIKLGCRFKKQNHRVCGPGKGKKPSHRKFVNNWAVNNRKEMNANKKMAS